VVVGNGLVARIAGRRATARIEDPTRLRKGPVRDGVGSVRGVFRGGQRAGETWWYGGDEAPTG